MNARPEAAEAGAAGAAGGHGASGGFAPNAFHFAHYEQEVGLNMPKGR